MAVIYKGISIMAGKVEEIAEKLQTALNKLRGKSLEKYLDELLEVALDNIKGEGLYGGKILSKADLEIWERNLFKKYGTKLEKVDGFDNPNILAQFDSNTNTIRYKDDVTEYIMAHESFHAEHMKKIGFVEYNKEAPLKGVKEANYTTENWLNLYRKEKYVYDKLVENAKKFKLNSEELSIPPLGHAFHYIDSIIIELEILQFLKFDIMLEQKLEQKLKTFLQENNRQFYTDSIKYLKLRKRGTIDGGTRNLHIVSFMVSVSDQQYDSDWFFYASFDEKNYNLIEIIGPQSYENFEK